MRHLLILLLLGVAVRGHTIHRTNKQVESGFDDKPESRVVNGIVATRGQFPYQAALYYEHVFCAGSLISQRWVLTCGNCARGSSYVAVHLGAQNLNNVNTEPGRFVIQTTKILIHHALDIPNAANNIALVNLGLDIPLSDYIKPISLASGSNLYADYPARISGWGRDKSSGSISAELKYTDLTVLSNQACVQIFPGVYGTQICAKGPNDGGICNEDSGGALVELVSGRQIAIATSWAASGCESNMPSIYTRVSSFATWITANTGILL